jgi:hypothetical protein
MSPWRCRPPSWLLVFAGVSLALASTAPRAAAQGFGGPTVRDSTVGYIDDAIPGDVFRFRFDAAYGDNRPSRAEFFYARPGPNGPGPPRPDRNVDFQDLSSYVEFAVRPDLSGFVNVPVRFLNPQGNDNTVGLADVDAGFKYAFLRTDDRVASFQLRTYAPTGEHRHGIGTGHVSLEPAFLLFQRLDERLTLEAELRDWIPVGGTDFSGNVIRYGVGVSYEALRTERWSVTPVAEVVGWTVLGGKENVVPPSGFVSPKSAAGDTIVNAKLGARVKLGDWGDLYAGYGRALTGDRWYENTFRVEWRLFY